jgi:copper chaperone CopZ
LRAHDRAQPQQDNFALKLVDPVCEVSVDLASRKVRVSSVEDRAEFVSALTESGYPPAA